MVTQISSCQVHISQFLCCFHFTVHKHIQYLHLRLLPQVQIPDRSTGLMSGATEKHSDHDGATVTHGWEP